MKWIALATPLLAAALLAGCGGDDTDESTPTASPAISSTLTLVPGSSATVRPTEVTRSPTTPATATSAPSTGRCETDNLSLEPLPAGAAAGTHFVALVVTNTGDEPCIIQGYPGVSLLDSSGKQIGPAAERNPAFPSTPVTLQPGEKANATIGLPAWQNFDANVCPQESVSIQVYAPDNLDSLVVPFTDHACPGFSVRTFEAGVGEGRVQ